MKSDDGFEIGVVTFKGTYDLIALGAVVGLLGVGACRVVSPWLIGPAWFRAATTGLGAAAVVGSMIVHADGIDFTLLEPVWLAIGLFVAIPAPFGVAVGPALAYGDDQGSWINRGRWRWLVPIVVTVLSPFALLLAPVVAAAAFVSSGVRTARPGLWTRIGRAGRLVVRAGFLGIALLGAFVLVGDIDRVLQRR